MMLDDASDEEIEELDRVLLGQRDAAPDWMVDLNGVPVGKRLLLGHEMKCLGCGSLGGFHFKECPHYEGWGVTSKRSTLEALTVERDKYRDALRAARRWIDTWSEIDPADALAAIDKVLGES
jgi:hypothetical protein